MTTRYPMPFADALRCSHLEAQQYAVQRMCNLMSDDIMREAFTKDEQTTLQNLLGNALRRTTAGLAEYDIYKRVESPEVEMAGEWML